jgi:5-methylcytosine-specific restriction enzyme subunit McrC
MIPIANIYYLLSYALRHTQLLNDTELASIEGGKPEDLLGLLLSRFVDRLLKRGLDRGYISLEEALCGMRGRIDVSQTVIQVLRRNGKVACAFDELRHDILSNQIVVKTLRSLLTVSTLSNEIRTLIGATLQRFPWTSDITLTHKLFRDVVIHRNNRHYGIVIDLCRLIYVNLIADAGTEGTNRFKDFRRDEAQMGKLFEDFVREFLRSEQNCFSVLSPQIPWAISDLGEPSRSLLPRMQSDIILENTNLVRIIDTKFYRSPLSRHYEAEKIHSGNMYQIFTYVMNYAQTKRRKTVEGMLLYASAGSDIGFESRILDHRIAVETIDLTLPWNRIRSDLISRAATAVTAS